MTAAVADQRESSPAVAPVGRTVAVVRPVAGRVALATLLGAATALAGIALLATSGWLISRAAEHPSIAALGLAVVAVRFFALSRGVFRYCERLVGHDAALRALGGLRRDLYDGLERVAPAGLPGSHRGDLLARLVGDVDALQDVVVRVVPPFAIAAVTGGATLLLLGWMLPVSALVVGVPFALAAVAVPALTRRLAHRSEARLAGARGELTVAMVDLLEGGQELLAMGAMPAQLARVAAADAELTGLSRARARTTGVAAGLLALLGGLAVVGALVVGVAAVAAGDLDGVLLAVVVLTPLALFDVVVGLPGAGQALERVRPAAARIFAVTDAPSPVPDPATPVALPADAEVIRARGLRARHRPDRAWALDGIDLDLAPGRRIAVVGPSGAGKSTLAACLVRFLDYEGSFTLGGVEAHALTGDDVRRVVGLVEQSPHVFDTTLAENLRLARPTATDHELRDALAQARLGDWVDTLPAGLATPVGERGARLSGGQRQRLALARALIARFPVLVLDEPVEHLDGPTADAVTAMLLGATTGTATLLITHRLVGLEGLDEIVVLDAGRVVERGTHHDLLAAGGHYARAWTTQRQERQ